LNEVLPIQTVALLREQSMKALDTHDARGLSNERRHEDEI
jgi:hypothetical protein